MTATALRIAFMGSPDFAVPTLSALVDAGHDVVCVYAQPPRRAGRGQRERLTPVDQAAIDLGIEVRTPTSLRDPAEQQAFAALEADVAVVVAYGLILPKPILDAPRLGCVNVHASLLPRWRGAAPIQRAILAGDPESGVTIMQMDEGLDTGDMLIARSVAITSLTTGQSLHDDLSRLGAEMIVPALAGLADGSLTGTPQPADGVTYAKKLERDEGRLDFTRSAAELERLVRAFDPWPGAFVEHAGTRIKVLEAEAFDLGPISNPPGMVLDQELTIACRDGAFRPLRLQRPGRAPVETAAFLRGFEIPPGTILGG